MLFIRFFSILALLGGFLQFTARTQIAENFYKKGNWDFDNENYAEAIISYSNAISSVTNDDNEGLANIYFNRGLAYYYSGKYTDAIRDYSIVIRSELLTSRSLIWR